MSSMFSGCKCLILLLILGWSTDNVENIGKLFYNCESLTKINDISQWSTNNIKDMNSIFL